MASHKAAHSQWLSSSSTLMTSSDHIRLQSLHLCWRHDTHMHRHGRKTTPENSTPTSSHTFISTTLSPAHKSTIHNFPSQKRQPNSTPHQWHQHQTRRSTTPRRQSKNTLNTTRPSTQSSANYIQSDYTIHMHTHTSLATQQSGAQKNRKKHTSTH